MAKIKNPKWWSEDDSSAWERVKTAFRRDWEQTKNDFNKKKGRDLDQDVDDTVKQAVGAQKIPPGNQPNREDQERDWDSVETGARFGFGARRHFSEHDEWDERLESRLRREWEDLHSSTTWDQARAEVQSGWERGKPGDFPRSRR